MMLYIMLGFIEPAHDVAVLSLKVGGYAYNPLEMSSAVLCSIRT